MLTIFNLLFTIHFLLITFHYLKIGAKKLKYTKQFTVTFYFKWPSKLPTCECRKIRWELVLEQVNGKFFSTFVHQNSMQDPSKKTITSVYEPLMFRRSSAFHWCFLCLEYLDCWLLMPGKFPTMSGACWAECVSTGRDSGYRSQCIPWATAILILCALHTLCFEGRSTGQFKEGIGEGAVSMLESNPLPATIDIGLKAEYAPRQSASHSLIAVTE